MPIEDGDFIPDFSLGNILHSSEVRSGEDFKLPFIQTDRTLYFRVRFPSSECWSQIYSIDRRLYCLKSRFDKHRAEEIRWDQNSQRFKTMPSIYFKRSWNDECRFRRVDIYCNLVILNKTGLFLRYNDNSCNCDGFGRFDFETSDEEQTQIFFNDDVPVMFDSPSNSLMILPYGTRGLNAGRFFIYCPYTEDDQQFNILRNLTHLKSRVYADGDDGDTIISIPISLESDRLKFLFLQTFKNRLNGRQANSSPIIFKISSDATIYVCFESDSRKTPQWLLRLGFQQTGWELVTRRVKYSILKRNYKAYTKVVLGANARVPFFVFITESSADTFEPFVSDPELLGPPTYFQHLPFVQGDCIYIDNLSLKAQEIPPIMLPTPLLLLQCYAKSSIRSHFLEFDIHQRSKVFMCIENQNSNLPSWVSDLGFCFTSQILRSGDILFNVYLQIFDAGRVVLGSLKNNTSSNYNYFAVIANVEEDYSGDSLEASDLSLKSSEGLQAAGLLHEFWNPEFGEIIAFPNNFETSYLTWSRPFNITENNKGEVFSSSCALSARVQSLVGTFWRSRAITLLPRFILINNLPFAIDFYSFNHSNFVNLPYAEVLGSIQKNSLLPSHSCAIYQFPPLYINSNGKYGEADNLPFIFVEITGYDDSNERSVCPICLNRVGEQFVWLQATDSTKLILSASVMAQGTVFSIVLSQARIFPFRLENRSHAALHYRQYNSETLWESLDSMRWKAFIWTNPFIDEKRLEVSIGVVGDESVLIDLSDVGRVAKLSCKVSCDFGTNTSQNVGIEVDVDVNTRVLRVFDASAIESPVVINEESGTKNITSISNRRIESRSSSFSSLYMSSLSAEIVVESIYVRLVDDVDLLGISLDFISLEYNSENRIIHFQIYHVQVDDLSSTAKFPVIFAPSDSGKNSHLRKGKFKRQNCFGIIANAMPSMGNILCFNYVDISVGAASIRICMELLWTLISFIGKLANNSISFSSRMDMSTTGMETDAVRSILEMTVSDRIFRSSTIFSEVTFYVKRFHYCSIILHLEILVGNKFQIGIGGGDRSVAIGLALLGSPMLSFLSSIVGSIAHVSPVFIFDELLVSNFFGGADKLWHMIYTVLNQQAFSQAYKLFGSLELIGNPLSFIDNIKTGVSDFYSHTMEEMEGNAITRGEGVRRLAYSVIIGTFGSASKVSGALADLSRVVSGKKMNSALHTERPDTVIGGLHHGGLAVIGSIEKGVFGLVDEPRRGLQREGLLGIIKGFGKGFVRLFASPVTGLLDAVTIVAESVENQAQSVDGKPVDRLLRPMKPVEW